MSHQPVPYLFEEARGKTCGESSYLDMPEDKVSVVQAHILYLKGVCSVEFFCGHPIWMWGGGYGGNAVVGMAIHIKLGRASQPDHHQLS